ncbi:MAG TPA: YdbH domain-containing protein [Alphaproteobacteria bacterium]|nr:YdbH domain-containing protein [Alphaproteobacteria bacterium]HNS44217.1 YdbH domain-containing protein [Alphaproteobacteria bacterium]
MARGHIRKALRFTGTGVVLAGGFIGASIYGGPYLVAKVLRGNGFPAAHASGVSLSPAGLYIDHISLDGDDFSSIDQVSVQFSWGTLLSSRTIERLNIKSIELTGEIDEAGHFKLAGWDATTPTSSSSSTLLPLSSLLVQGATLDLDTPEGDLRIEGKLSVDTDAAKDTQKIAFSLWGRQKQLSFTLNGNGKISANGGYDLSAELLEGRVSIPQIELSRVSGWASTRRASGAGKTVYAGQILAGRVKALNALLQNVDFTFDTAKGDPFFFKTSPAGFPNVVLAGRWNATPPAQMEITVDAQDAADLYKIVKEDPDEAGLSYLHALSPLTAQIALPPSVFDSASPKEAAWAVLLGEKKTRISGVAAYYADTKKTDVTFLPVQIPAGDISNLLPENLNISLASGNIGLEGKASVLSGDEALTFSGPVSLDLRSVAGEWSGTVFSDLKGKISFSSLSPWAMDKTSLSYTLQGKNAEIGTGSLTCQGSQDKGLTISSSWLNVAGGMVTTSPFTVLAPDQTAATDINVKLDHLQMADLSKLVEVDSFSAAGQISGTIPLTIKDGKISFKSGAIANEGDGYFKYTPDQFPTSLQGDDPRMKTVRDALSDFKFTELSLDLNGPMDGHMTTTLKASGTSPLFGERPISLNLNLEGDLGQVLRNTLQAGDIGSTLRSIKGDKK